MKAIRLCFVPAIFFILLLLENYMTQGATTSEAASPASQSTTCCGGSGDVEKLESGYRHQLSHSNRVSRSPPPNTMEEKLKDFATKLGKTPDDLRAAFGKFMLAQGISVQQMQEEIEHAHQATLQMLGSIKKAMHV